MKKNSVLFVYIGWAQWYDGTEVLRGSHAFIKKNQGDPQKISEGSAFLSNPLGFASCGAGIGDIRDVSDMDVVFVAKETPTSPHRAVGIYFSPTFEFEELTGPSGAVRKFAIAKASRFFRIRTPLRPTVPWVGRGMRRWLLRNGNVEHSELQSVYEKLVALAERDQQSDQGLLGEESGFARDAEMRELVDKQAVAVVKDHFARLGKVEVMPHNNPGFDIKVEYHDGRPLLQVEVKGTRGDGSAVSLTESELRLLREGSSVLAVVKNIEVDGRSAKGGVFQLYDNFPSLLEKDRVSVVPLTYKLILQGVGLESRRRG